VGFVLGQLGRVTSALTSWDGDLERVCAWVVKMQSKLPGSPGVQPITTLDDPGATVKGCKMIWCEWVSRMVGRGRCLKRTL